MTTDKDNQPRLSNRLSKTFVAGLLAALPLALTVAVIIWFGDLLHRYLGPNSFVGKLFGSIGLNFVTSEITAYAVGIGFVLLVIWLLGVAVEAGLKNHWRGFTSGVIERVPLVRSIYRTVNKLITMFDKQEQAEYKNMSAVMVYFGGDRKGTSVLAMLTSATPVMRDDTRCYAIMIPTAPVPFGGALIYVPVEWVEEMEFGFDGLFNIYMSMGVSSADYLNTPAAGTLNKKK